MAGNKRIVITDEETVKRLNLMAAVLCKDPAELGKQAVDLLWEQKGQCVLEQVSQMSPVADHLPKAEEGQSAESEQVVEEQ